MKILKFSNEHKQKVIDALIEKIAAAKNIKEIEAIKIPAMGKVSEIKAPTILYTPKAYFKMHALIQSCDVEIQWHGIVDHEEDTNTYIVQDIIMYHQYVSGGRVDTDDTKYAKWLMEQMRDKETFKRIRMHGHSHVKMKTGASAIDNTYQADMAAHFTDFYIFVIGNKDQEFNHMVYDVKQNAFFERTDITIGIILQENPRITTKEWGDLMVKEYTAPFPIPAKPIEHDDTIITTIAGKSIKVISDDEEAHPAVDSHPEFEHVGFPADRLHGQIDWRESLYGSE